MNNITKASQKKEDPMTRKYHRRTRVRISEAICALIVLLEVVLFILWYLYMNVIKLQLLWVIVFCVWRQCAMRAQEFNSMRIYHLHNFYYFFLFLNL